MRRYLIVANLTLGGDHLWDEVRTRMDAGPCHFHVLVPAAHPPLGGTWTEDEAHREAEQRLERMLARLHEIGAEADGEVGDIRAIDSTLDALREADYDYDEVIISTLPVGVSRWLKLDLVSRLQRAVDPVPVTHVVGDADAGGPADSPDTEQDPPAEDGSTG